jgi:signal transduction histidine kinase/CheY-like chemotaxis protein
MNNDSSRALTVDEVLITEELELRPVRVPDHSVECAASTLLARQLAADPQRFWQRAAELAIDLCHAHSAGVMMGSPGAGADAAAGVGGEIPGIAAVAGPLAHGRGQMPAIAEGFWGAAVRRNAVTLFREPARYFAALRDVEPPIVEALAVPWAVDDAVAGVIWAAVHTHDKRFDREDARLLRTLVPFACAAWRMNGALVDANESLETDRQKDEFLMTLAHELRNPLASISNVAQLLRTHPTGQALDDVLGMLDRQVYHVTRLVDDLMDVSRIARGKVELNMQPTALAEVVRSAVEACMPQFERKQQTLTVSLPDAPVILNADGVRLTQIISNLLHNAAKYSDAGARTWLTASRGEGENIVISVRDSGVGIPREALRRVFDLFAQAHRDTDAGQRGLGIGLTMVQRLVELHGGEVEARSAGPGLGSEFVVRLPVGRILSYIDTAPHAVNRAALAGHSVIVVDDNRDSADSLAMWLASKGAQAYACYDGTVALAAVERTLPCTVLLDLEMPGMDGYAVAQRVRQDERLRGVRLIALTGQVSEGDRIQDAGFDHCFTKPVNLHALETWLTAHA